MKDSRSFDEFIKELGWPDDRMDAIGSVVWSSTSADGVSMLEAGVSRSSGEVSAWVRTVGLDGIEPMLDIEARAVEGGLEVGVAKIGNPPDSIETQDALDLFKHMSSGMGKPKFSFGGSVIGASKPRG